MAVEVEMFKAAMRMLAGGVTIVTSSLVGRATGLTATAICSLSAMPPRLLACINLRGQSYQMISQSRHFCVNVLASEQRDLAMRFAGMHDIGDADRFDDGEWYTLATGAPVLTGALAVFDCNVAMALDTGSHAIIIGDIVAIRRADTGSPLLYADSRFESFISASRQQDGIDQGNQHHAQ